MKVKQSSESKINKIAFFSAGKLGLHLNRLRHTTEF